LISYGIPISIQPCIVRHWYLVIPAPGIAGDEAAYAGIEVPRPEIGQPRGVAELAAELVHAGPTPRAGEGIVESIDVQARVRHSRLAFYSHGDRIRHRHCGFGASEGVAVFVLFAMKWAPFKSTLVLRDGEDGLTQRQRDSNFTDHNIQLNQNRAIPEYYLLKLRYHKHFY